MGGDFNADVIINIPPAFFSLQKSGLVRVYLTSVFLLLSVPRCFGDPKPQFDCDAQIQQDYALQKIKVVNDAVVASLPQGPDAGDNPPGAIALNRRFTVNVGGTNYYMYGSDIPAP